MHKIVLAGFILVSIALAGPSLAAPPAAPTFADPAFETVWSRTDLPVADHSVVRTWFWGPAPGATLVEPFQDSPGKVHLVQYFDKSRMEINNPAGDKTSPWYVTNGLLTVELISGRVQTGANRWLEKGPPAAIPLASDLDDHDAPTYASFRNLANTPLGDHRAPDRSGSPVEETINRAGQVAADQARRAAGVTYARYEPATGHNIPSVFWNFLNSRGPVREGGRNIEAPLSAPWFFTSGLPISEAYWARVKIAGATRDVLIQAFERRVLTYAPDNAPEWRVQMGNIGQHYVQWRYPSGLPLPVPTARP